MKTLSKKWLSVLIVFFTISHSYSDDEFTFDSIPSSEILCLAQNIYFEARDQNNEGRVAVAFVTLNRVNHPWYPKTYCDVIRDGFVTEKTNCQFSWYCDSLSDIPKEHDTWKDIQYFAFWFAYQNEYIVDPTEGATHYHSFIVEPWWSSKIRFNKIIGDHLFYTEDAR